MSISYRRAEPADIPHATRVYASAFNDLTRKYGFDDQVADPAQPNPYFAFALREEPEGFWIAEDSRQVVGMALAWLRGDFWYLADLFVDPAYQGRGIGRGLLERTMELGDRATITNRALITFAFNPVSTSLYVRWGMFPRLPLYRMVGPATVAQRGRRLPHTLEFDERQLPGRTVDELKHIDEKALGFTLARHHLYFLSSPEARCYVFRRADSVRGYAYVWSNGHIGPLAAASSEDLEEIVRTALMMSARQGAPQVSLLVPGSAEVAMSVVFEHGLKIALPLLLMSSKPFGITTNYVFHSPALM